jgi:hypothetical protein
VKFDRRFSDGFLMTTAYTFGKAINYVDDNGTLGVPINFRLNRGLGGFDRRHTYVQSFVYELPFGPGHRFLSSGPGKWVLGGWQVSGIFSAYSGLPLGITVSGTTLQAPGNTNRPNMNGTPEITGHIGVGQKYFDLNLPGSTCDPKTFTGCVFSPPPVATFGNVGRNILHGPKYINLDAALFKKFPITEKVSGEFRAESFNVSNTPQFDRPDGNLSGSSFGEVTGLLGDPRRFQFSIKFVF